jgi:hypothetical protein
MVSFGIADLPMGAARHIRFSFSPRSSAFVSPESAKTFLTISLANLLRMHDTAPETAML